LVEGGLQHGCGLLDVRAQHDDLVGPEIRQVMEGVEQCVAQHLRLAGQVVRAVDLHRHVTRCERGGCNPVRGGNRGLHAVQELPRSGPDGTDGRLDTDPLRGEQHLHLERAAQPCGDEDVAVGNNVCVVTARRGGTRGDGQRGGERRPFPPQVS
jgi:hypothetical protein